MTQPVAVAQAWPAWRDVVALGKPRLSLLVFCTAGVGMWLSPGSLGTWRSLWVLLACASVVAAANTLNSYLERDADARMHRTKRRPLPAGRIEARWALCFGIGLGLLAISILYALANPLTALLAFVAFASYVWIYTPMKRYSWAAVLVGAVPGAIPPMMGWTSVTGALDAPSLALFALLFVWQLPHFFAIALNLSDDYARGGMVVLPHVIGARATRIWLLVAAAALIPTSALPSWAGAASFGFAIFAVLTSIAFFALCAQGLAEPVARGWGRRVFLASVLHMGILMLAMLVDGAL